jgi:hypothetical protein
MCPVVRAFKPAFGCRSKARVVHSADLQWDAIPKNKYRHRYAALKRLHYPSLRIQKLQNASNLCIGQMRSHEISLTAQSTHRFVTAYHFGRIFLFSLRLVTL